MTIQATDLVHVDTGTLSIIIEDVVQPPNITNLPNNALIRETHQPLQPVFQVCNAHHTLYYTKTGRE